MIEKGQFNYLFNYLFNYNPGRGMKDFHEEFVESYQREQYQAADISSFVTPEVKQSAKILSLQKTFPFYCSMIFSNLIVAPLQTITASLQLSVKEHKEIYQTKQGRSKQLAKLNKEMTIHEKRNFEVMLRAGGKDIPYTAPVYSSYVETIKGLYSQGLRGFYKGLGYRTFITLTVFSPFVGAEIINVQKDKNLVKQLLLVWGNYFFLDLCMSPMHMMENRYILQNRIPQFRSIHRPFRTIFKSIFTSEATSGFTFHIINNAITLLARIYPYFLLMTGNSLQMMHYGLLFGAELFTYPFLTAYRRLACQTDRYHSMIPKRYSGLMHAVRVIAAQEGAGGLWRAFPLHCCQFALKIFIIQFIMRMQNIEVPQV